jgi:magnesium-dependent phosphatase 1
MVVHSLLLILLFSLMMSSAMKIRIGTVPWKVVPELIVFDLDMCMWSPEMYTLDTIPSKKDGISGSLGDGVGDGVIAVKSDAEQIRLFGGALQVLQDIHNGHLGEVRIAAASSADTPRAASIARAALDLLEVVPGVTARSVFGRGWPEGFDGNLQIGRTPPLSSDKASTHFPILKQQTGISYDKMVFFDDCNWGNHCAAVEKGCPGVVTQRTPRGMQINEFRAALDKYEKRYAGDA